MMQMGFSDEISTRAEYWRRISKCKSSKLRDMRGKKKDEGGRGSDEGRKKTCRRETEMEKKDSGNDDRDGEEVAIRKSGSGRG